MNSSNSVAEKTRNAVLRSKKRVWTIDDFKANKSAVLRELSRLARDGRLTRVGKGIYVRPVMTLLGPSTLSMEEIAKIRAHRKGALAIPTGYAVFNALGLTTQVSRITELAVDSPMRMSSSGVRFVVRKRQSLEDPAEHSILEALRRINHISDTSPEEVIVAIKSAIKLKRVDFERLALLALKSEPPRVRALLGAIGEELQPSSRVIERLHNSLNPTSRFNIPTGESLLKARAWRILD
jgi:hypothetical protein